MLSSSVRRTCGTRTHLALLPAQTAGPTLWQRHHNSDSSWATPSIPPDLIFGKDIAGAMLRRHRLGDGVVTLLADLARNCSRAEDFGGGKVHMSQQTRTIEHAGDVHLTFRIKAV